MITPKTRGSITVLAVSHSSDQPKLKCINPPSNLVKGDADFNDGVVVEALESSGDCERDSIVSVSKEDANQVDDESNSDSDSEDSVANFGLESAAGDDCLTCLDTKEAAVKSTCKKV